MNEENSVKPEAMPFPNEVRIGPNSNYWMVLAFSNPWIYLGFLVVSIAMVPMFVNLPDEISTYFTTEIRLWTALGGLIFAGICSLKGIILALTTEYIFDQSQNTLFIRRGIFSKDTNAINLRLIYDCDIHQSITERMFGAGTLRLKESDEKIYTVPFVNSPLDSRKLIMANSGVASARMISTVS